MGLALAVGVLASWKGVDESVYKRFHDDIKAVNHVLAKHGLPEHHEPEELEKRWSGSMMGYSGLHDVRRLAAYIYYDKPLPSPAQHRSRSAKDATLQRLYKELDELFLDEVEHTHLLPETAFFHLIEHSDCNGFYLPIDFENVIYGGKEVYGHYIGSSYRLQDECAFLARKLNLTLDDPDLNTGLYADCPNEDAAAPLWQQYGIESYCISQLYHGASASIEKKAALVFT